jgi:hypothetical protein
MTRPGDGKALCSTGHKAKGLEASSVLVYAGKKGFGVNVPLEPWEAKQENCIKYVVESRSLDKLTWIR